MSRELVARATKAGSFRKLCGGRISERILAGQQRLAAGLARDAHECGEGVLRRIPNTISHATIAIAEDDAAFVVHRHLVKVEKVAIFIATATLPYATDSLNRVIRCRIDNSPGIPAVVGSRNEQIPNAREGKAFIIAGAVRAEEANSGAVFVATNCLWEDGVFNSMARPKVKILRPGCAVVVADLDVDVTLCAVGITGYVGKVNPVVLIDCDRRIAAMRLRLAIRNNMLGPSNARVGAHDQPCVPVAIPHRDVRCAIRTDMNMSVDATALTSEIRIVNRNAGSVAHPKRIATLARCPALWISLSAVVNRATLISHDVGKQATSRIWT